MDDHQQRKQGHGSDLQLLPRWGNLPGLTMKVIVDLCVVPIGVGVHLAPFIAACEKVLTEAGLKIQLHPNGTAKVASVRALL
jgi:hypothetical protein